MIAYGHSDLSAGAGHPSAARSSALQGGRAHDRRCLQEARQARPRLRGDGSADRGILEARLQGLESARHRHQHLPRRPQGPRRSCARAAQIDWRADAVTLPSVTALYRYPVKGLHAGAGGATSPCCRGGRVAGDRVLNFRFADAPAADTRVVPQVPRRGAGEHSGPRATESEIRRAQPTSDYPGRRTSPRRRFTGRRGRQRLVDAVTGYVLSLDENPLKGHSGRLPLKLVGDGTAPRYQDNRAGQVTLHSRESLLRRRGARGHQPGRTAFPA